MKINDTLAGPLKVWNSAFLEAEVEPMDQDAAKTFLSICGKEKTPMPKEIQEMFLVQVISKRAEYLGLPMTPGLIAFLTLLAGSPGTAVMFLTVLKYNQLATGTTETYGMAALGKLFPMGFPNKEKLGELWDLQKLANGANMVDSAFVPRCLIWYQS